jgi:hypothetical protein
MIFIARETSDRWGRMLRIIVSIPLIDGKTDRFQMSTCSQPRVVHCLLLASRAWHCYDPFRSFRGFSGIA